MVYLKCHGSENLMGVKSENEPLSGTDPDRRLFDRSLQYIFKFWSTNVCYFIFTMHIKKTDLRTVAYKLTGLEEK